MENSFQFEKSYAELDDYLFITAMIVCLVPAITCLYFYLSEYFDKEPSNSLFYLKRVNLGLLLLHTILLFTSLPKINLLVGMINYALYLALNVKRNEPKYYIHSSVFNFKALFPSSRMNQIYIFNTGVVLLHYILWSPFMLRFSFVLYVFFMVFFYPTMDLFYQIRSTKTLPIFNKQVTVRFKAD
eukprot:NODE_427_length_8836_cov_0.452215.p5 type:complete len:185 gc:universal NODE_427_length_8836_cov_0.452215:4033-4587(+)